MRFAAIDFETANHDRASACAVGLVVVEGGQIVDRTYSLIRPPTRQFLFTHLHGLSWNDVQDAPMFAELWERLRRPLDRVAFIAAHNAPFDRAVLSSCAFTYGLSIASKPFVCTVRIARQIWRIYPTKLPDVCARLGIPLRHHRADADAEACARIVLAAEVAGWRPHQTDW